MSRNLLHVSKLGAFSHWLADQGIEQRSGRGEFEVLQVKTRTGQWHCIFSRCHMPEHYTVAKPLVSTVHRFIREGGRE